MERLFWICLGGAAGTAARYGVGLWAAGRFNGPFPVGTIAVNLVGCFAIALIMSVAIAADWSPTVRLGLTVGVLGGFTTYSAFSYETLYLIQTGAWARAAVNVLVTTAGCIALCGVGMAAGRALRGG